MWYARGLEGLEQDHVKAVALFRTAADTGDWDAQSALAGCYYLGSGLDQSYVLAAEWGCKAADHGHAGAQFFVGKIYAYGEEGVKKDLPVGKRYLELSAAQGLQEAVALLRELRKCASCGELDVHHMICAWCRNVRYCDGACQARHWQRLTDPHKPHCGRRREVAVAGASSSEPSANIDECAMKDALEAKATRAVKLEAAQATAKVAVSESAAETEVVKAALTALKAATAVMLAAPAASKKEKKKKAKLVAKEKGADATMQAAVKAAREAGAASVAATGLLTAILHSAT